MSIHAEIMYGKGATSVHSDVCPPKCEFQITEDYRDFLHKCLDEWLNKSNGTGMFYIGEEAYFQEYARD